MHQRLRMILRSIWKGKFYSLVSIAGLAVALASVVLVATLIRHETSFESQYAKADQIYRLTWTNPGTGDQFATMFNPFSPQLAIDDPDVVEAARVGTFQQLVTRETGDLATDRINFENFAYVDPTFFSVFDFDLLAGQADGILDEPGSLVLTQTAAQKYFGDENPIGQTLLLEKNIILTVKGVIPDMPRNTHFPFHFMIPLETLREIYNGAEFLDFWGSDRLYHYVVLADGAVPAEIIERLPAFAARHSGFDDASDIIFGMHRLTDIHFMPDLQDDYTVRDTVLNVVKAPRPKQDLILFSAGAFILTLIASFNFMNLQVARSVGKGKNMGLLKVFGATRRGVIEYTILESLVLSGFALGLATILVEVLLPSFAQVLAVSLGWADVLQPANIAVVLALTISLGLLTAIYPALVLGSQSPNEILRGEFSLGARAAKIRQTLVLLQFAVSIVLIVVSFGIFSQIKFSMESPLGFEEDGVAVVNINRPEAAGVYDGLRLRMLEHPDIEYVTRASIVPTGNLSDGAALAPPGAPLEQAVAFRRVGVDYDYFETFGIEMAAGRAYNRQFPGDEFNFPTPDAPVALASVILNETMAKKAGWANPEDAIGQVMWNQFDFGGATLEMQANVVGIAKDVHFRSLRSEIVPMGYLLSPGSGGKMAVKMTGENEAAALAHIEQAWAELVPSLPFSYEWLDSAVTQLYAQERRTMNLVAGISVIAVFIACLGLFAVATLVTETRTKEVGLRKVLGAQVRQIVNLLSWQFLKPVILANIIAWPLAWFYMNDWLNSFAYRVDLGALTFLVPGALALIIAWATVAAQAWSVARANPVHALRYE